MTEAHFPLHVQILEWPCTPTSRVSRSWRGCHCAYGVGGSLGPHLQGRSWFLGAICDLVPRASQTAASPSGTGQRTSLRKQCPLLAVLPPSLEGCAQAGFPLTCPPLPRWPLGWERPPELLLSYTAALDCPPVRKGAHMHKTFNSVSPASSISFR